MSIIWVFERSDCHAQSSRRFESVYIFNDQALQTILQFESFILSFIIGAFDDFGDLNHEIYKSDNFKFKYLKIRWPEIFRFYFGVKKND